MQHRNVNLAHATEGQLRQMRHYSAAMELARRGLVSVSGGSTPPTPPNLKEMTEEQVVGYLGGEITKLLQKQEAITAQLAEVKGFGDAFKVEHEKTLALQQGLEDSGTRLEVIERMLKAQAKWKLPGPIPGTDGGKELTALEREHGRPYSLAKAFIAHATPSGAPSWNGAELERDMGAAMAKKAIEIGTDTGGGYLVPGEVLAGIVDLLRAKTVIRASGATILGGLMGSPVKLPVITAGSTHYWMGEAEAVTASAPTYGELELTPKKSAALVLINEEFRKLSPAAAEQWVLGDIVSSMALGEDAAYLNGFGAKRPRGIFQVPNILTKALAGPVTFQACIQMVYQLMLNNNFGGNLVWYCHPRTWRDLAMLQDTNGRNIWQPDPSMGIPMGGRIWGIPVWPTTAISIDIDGDASGKSHLALANATDILVADWGGLEIARSDHYKFAEGQHAIRATRLTDIQLRRPKSLVLDATITDGNP